MFRLQTPLPERYVHAAPEELETWIRQARQRLGTRCVVLGHHYQRDEVMRWADARGDSFGLARFAADQREADYVVFCGVQFMAESADVLTAAHQQVVLPDLNAGCSMADMADLEAVETAWDELARVVDRSTVLPITYMNSSATLKDFVGRNGGAVCTSSNATAVVTWALERADKVLFFPDQHLGRNTAVALGYDLGDTRVWDPRLALGGLEDVDVKAARFLLWKGHCSVHQRFRPAHVEAFRAAHPGGVVAVHPECSHEVVALADVVGSTDAIIRYVDQAPAGTAIGIATEIHLVHRLANEHPGLTVSSLDPLVCPCSTMFRIDEPHLAWVLEGLAEGEVRNRIVVPGEVAEGARIALERMLSIS